MGKLLRVNKKPETSDRDRRAMCVRESVSLHADEFGGRRS
jgi:hypothetical protein